MPTTWTHCNVDIKILTKRSLDKADVDVISTHRLLYVQLRYALQVLQSWTKNTVFGDGFIFEKC